VWHARRKRRNEDRPLCEDAFVNFVIALLLFTLSAGCDSSSDAARGDASTMNLGDGDRGDGDGDGDTGDGDTGDGDAGDGDDDEGDSNPILCGGGYEDPCGAGRYCHTTEGCGTVGHCRPRDYCDDSEGPLVICGCDGKTYQDQCEAVTAGISWAHEGACLPAMRQFECGDFTCSNDSYCLDKGPRNIEGAEERYVCLALPTDCKTNSCECAQKLDGACYAGSTCKVDGNHLTVRCE
jgi:hypothetical protein